LKGDVNNGIVFKKGTIEKKGERGGGGRGNILGKDGKGPDAEILKKKKLEVRKSPCGTAKRRVANDGVRNNPGS